MTSCYWCHREINDQRARVVKNVNTGFLGLSEIRVAFHNVCAEEHRKKERRNLLMYLLIGALVVAVPSVLIYLTWLL